MGAARPHWRLRRCVSRTGFCILPSLRQKNKRPLRGAFYFSGGERGIDSSLRSSPLRGACGVQTGCAGLSNSVQIQVPPSVRKSKGPRIGGLLISGGERGIRTLEGLLTLTPLAGERFRPLSHLSEIHIFSSRAQGAL